MAFKIDITLAVFCMSVSFLQAQDRSLPVYHYPFKAYTIKEGLSQTQCMSIFQDSKGFIWVGTKEGINRFDGLQFINYKTDSIFPKDYIKDIDEDKDGNIWFAGDQGIYKYDWDTVINYYNPSEHKFVPQAIEYDPLINKFWILMHNDKTGLEASLLQLDGIINPVNIKLVDKYEKKSNICYDRSNKRLLLFTETSKKSIQIYSIKNKKVSLIKSFKKAESGYFVTKGKNFEIYFSINKYVFEIESKSNSTFLYEFPCDSCFVRGFSDFLVANNTKLFLKQENTWVDAGIELNTVNDLLISKNGNFWAATEEGLIKISRTPFQNYSQNRGMLRYVWDINEGNNGEIWFSSLGFGLAYLKNNAYFYPPKYNAIPDKRKFYMGGITTSKGDILFPDETNILAYNPKKGFHILEGTENQKPVLCIYEDTINHRLLFGTNGLKVIEENGSVYFYDTASSLDIARFRYITAIEKDKNGNFWLGSHRGLSKFDGKKFQNFYPPKDIKSGVISIHRDYKDNLWFGTHDGLLLYDSSQEKPIPILENEISESVSFVTTIDSSFLIVGLLTKLFVLDLKQFYKGKLVIQYFDEENGFEGGEIGQNGYHIDRKKTIWITTTNSVTRFFPNQLEFDTMAPSILLSRLEAFKFGSGEITKDFNLLSGKNSSIRINSKENHIRLYYLSTCEDSPARVTYQYKLGGFDDNWSNLSKERFVNYTNLPIGKFIFQVRACKYGSCSKAEEIEFQIYPATLWELTFVKILLIVIPILFVAAAILLFKRRQYRQRHKILAFERELDVLKLETMLNQIDPHFFFNALSSLNDLINKNRGIEANRFIGEISEILRPLIRKGSKKMMRTLQEELEFVKTYIEIENIKLNNAINFVIEIDSNVNLNCYVPQTAIQTFVNNAVKHGLEENSGGIIYLYIHKMQDFIEIIIQDNGIGREEAAHRNAYRTNGNGINIIYQTLEWLNKKYPFTAYLDIIDLKDQGQHSLGTKVVVRLFSEYKIH